VVVRGADKQKDVGRRCWLTMGTRLSESHGASRLSPRTSAKLRCAKRPDSKGLIAYTCPAACAVPSRERQEADCAGCRATSRGAEGRSTTVITSVPCAPTCPMFCLRVQRTRAAQHPSAEMYMRSSPVDHYYRVAVWSSGMILAQGARGPGLNSRNSPFSSFPMELVKRD